MIYQYTYKDIFQLLLGVIIFSLFISSNTKAANLPNLPFDIDNQNFCVKEPDAFDRDYHHVMIIIDRTSFLEEQQVKWITENLFNKLVQ